MPAVFFGGGRVNPVFFRHGDIALLHQQFLVLETINARLQLLFVDNICLLSVD